ncbi:MAG: HEAT repeat domain-containing protein [Planctomycetes bacterium]|nr:HEAT repeat domain-containing protein [Planctomycetota bacterium]
MPIPKGCHFGLALVLLSCPLLMRWATGQESDLPAVPDLIVQLDSSDKFERRDAAMYLAAHGPAAADAVTALIDALDDRETQVWFHAVTALSRIGPAAKAAIPRLIADIDRHSDRGANPKWYRSVHALGMVGPAAIPALTKGLSHGDEDVRAGAAAALGWMGPEAAETTALLVGLLDDNDEFVREKAAETLGLIGPSVLPAVKEALRSGSANARQGAARVATQMGSPAAELAPHLKALARSDEQPRVQATAIDALWRVGMDDSEYAAILFELFHHDSEAIRQAVKNGLLSLPPQHSVHRLIHILDTRNDELSGQAADLLGRIGPPAADAVIPLINSVTGDRAAGARAAYRQALTDIGPVAVPRLLESLETTRMEDITAEHWVVICLREMGLEVVASLNEHLSHEHPHARLCSILALTGMGKDAGDSEALLLDHFDDPDSRVRAAAIPAAVAVAKQPDRLLDRIGPLLDDDDARVRLGAAVAVSSIGSNAVSLVPELTAMLDDPDMNVRCGAVTALGGIGPRAEGACEPIAKLLGSHDEGLKLAAVRALGEIGGLSQPALSQLATLAADENDTLKEAALVSLGQMGRDARKALPVFEQALSDPNDTVRVAAVIGFGRIEDSAEKLLPVMDAALGDSFREIRHAAAQRIGQLRDEGTAATPKLIEMLADSDDQSVALKALGRIPPAVEHLSLYIESLSHRDYIVRGYSCEALGKLHGKAKEALPALRKARQDRNRFVRQRASRAIERVEGQG